MEENLEDFEHLINNPCEILTVSNSNLETDLNNDWNFTYYTKEELIKLNEHIKM